MAPNLIFRKTNSVDLPAEYLVRQIKDRLGRGQQVLWLVSGGSSIAVAVKAAQLLREADVGNLTVGLIDERYGPPGHIDSNWQQLMNAGFSLKGARLQPVLIGIEAGHTLKQYNDFMRRQFDQADYKIGLLGLGADGHTAGILPNSAAVDAHGLVTYYDTPQFQRFTLTAEGLEGLSEAVVYAQGRPKWKTLDQLTEDLPLSYQPAQILKKIAKVTIFNDYKGDSE